MLPGSSLERLICSFSGAGDLFAVATPDGRLRIFDTGNGRLLVTLGGRPEANGATANGHLTAVHTCLAWVSADKEKGKKKQARPAAACLAVGTAAGEVKVYDVHAGELKWRAVDVIQGGVKSLSSSQGLVFATGGNCQIVTLDAQDGRVQQRFDASKYPVSCLAVMPDGKHAFGGGSSMQLWNLEAQERAAKYTGHPTEVRAIALSPNTAHAASAASGERHVALWEVPPAKKSKKQHSAVASLALEDAAVALDTCDSGEGSFHLAAVSEAGEAYVWACSTSERQAEGPGVDAQLLMHVRVGDGATRGASSGRDEVILGAHLQRGASGTSLVVARGSTAKPVFEALALPTQAPASAQEALVALPPVGGVLLGSSGDAAAAAAGKASTSGTPSLDKSIAQPARPQAMSGAGVAVVGADNLGQPVLGRSDGASGRKRAAEDDDPLAAAASAAAAGADAGGAMDEDEELEEEEVPLGERVAALEARTMGTAQQGEGEEAGTSGLAMPGGSAKADSLAVLLTQAVRSNDRALLERCLATSTPAVIHNTVARIMPIDAAAFLKAAVERLVSRPARAVQLVPWVQATLHHHTGYLMTAPGVQASLASLFQAIESRTKLHEPLLRVYGRLGLILHHTRDKHRQQATGAAAATAQPGPEFVLEEDLEEEEPAAEDAFAPGAISEGDDGDDDGSEGDGGEDEEDNEFDGMLGGAGGVGSDDDDFLDDDESDGF